MVVKLNELYILKLKLKAVKAKEYKKFKGTTF
jgi:hypothetical protein